MEDLRLKPLSFLQQHFGKSAAWYQAIANGEDDRPVVADRPRKSSGSETTFQNDLTVPGPIEAGVLAMANDVWAWCEKTKAFGRTVTVKVKFADFHQVTRSRSFTAWVASHDHEAVTNHDRKVFQWLNKSAAGFSTMERGVRRVGFSAKFTTPCTSCDDLPCSWRP